MAAVPGSASTSRSTSSGSGLRGCLSCFGCGCVIPVVGLGLLVVAAIFFLPRQFGTSSGDSPLPRPIEITREDRWSLQDKLKGAASQGNVMRLELTLPELNLLLSRIDLKPAAGFALNRVRAYISSNIPCLVLEGSGFWMRRLSIVLHLETTSRGCRIARMQVNGHHLPELLVRKAGIPWLERWLNGAAGIPISLSEQTEYSLSVASDVVTLTGPLPWLRTSPTGEGQ